MKASRLLLLHPAICVISLLCDVSYEKQAYAWGNAWINSYQGMVGKPAIALSSDGKLVAVVRNSTDNHYYYSYQISTTNDTWSSWSSLGGNFGHDPLIVQQPSSGVLIVFGRTPDGELWNKWQTSSGASSAFSSSWSPVATDLLNSDVAIGVNSNNMFSIISISSSGYLTCAMQTQAAPNPTWGGFSAISTTKAMISAQPSVVSNADGRLFVVARGSDNSIWGSFQTTVNTNQWGLIESFGGTFGSAPVVAANTDGTIEMFGRTPDGYMWRRRQTTVKQDIWQSSWLLMGGDGSWPGALPYSGDVTATNGGDMIGELAVISSPVDGRLGVMVRAQNSPTQAYGNTWVIWQSAASSDNWPYWSSLCGYYSGANPVVGVGPSNSVAMFMTDNSGNVYRKWCDAFCMQTKRRKIPVVAYHAFTAADGGTVPAGADPGAFVTQQSFLQQLQYLQDNRYTAIQFNQLEDTCNIEKPVLITADDGYVGEYSVMYPGLSDAGYTGAIFMVPNFFGLTTNGGYITGAQLAAMSPVVSAQNHTQGHEDLINLYCSAGTDGSAGSNAVGANVGDAQAQLAAYLDGGDAGLPPPPENLIAFAYPFGMYDTRYPPIPPPLYPAGNPGDFDAGGCSTSDLPVPSTLANFFWYATAFPDPAAVDSGVPDSSGNMAYALGDYRYTMSRVRIFRADDLNSFIGKIGGCAHSECSCGGALVQGCGFTDCVATVCNQRSSCCSSTWDITCAQLAQSQCGICPTISGC